MSRMRTETKNRIKEEIYSLLDYEAKTVMQIAYAINRSWPLTDDLLKELLLEKKNVDSLKVGRTKTYFLFKKQRYWHYTR